jgi:peptidoglycan hydrolase CwlO-like protein
LLSEGICAHEQMFQIFKKTCLLTLFLVLLVSLVFQSVLAVSEEECKRRQEEDVGDGIACWETLLGEVGARKTTLQSEITKFDTTIALTTAKITQTINQIEELEKEIASLGGKIAKLDLSLDQVSEILIKRVAETYKKGKIDPLALFLSSKDFSEFIGRYKYLRVMQIHDRKLIVQMETVRTNYEDQKTLKEKKQAELELAKKKLESQKVLLAQQKASKANLLAVTKNNEKKYQQLLAEAVAQQKAFSSFVSREGGASILENQTVCDGWGCYYNQRDSEWGRNSLGTSGLSVAEYGCLVSSVAMIASHQGKNIKPSDIASTASAFFGDTAFLLDDFSVNGIHVRKQHVSSSLLDSELSAGRPVIAGLYAGPDHFIVIKEKRGDDYIMHDPFLENGANRPLSEKYSVSDISSLRLVSFE